ncbi:MAG TPA: PspC domain-containing protein [Pseudonocardia sp.]|nr:PspC domain-containing protein [Pseudonocardia sp.]
MNETTSNPETPATPVSDHTPDAVVSPTPPADPTPPTDPTPADPTPPAAAVPPAASTRQPVRLRRSRDERMIAGVCGGLAETLGIDVVILRLALVLATVLGVGAGVILYVACWILMPQAPEATSAPGTEANTDLLPAVRTTA